MGLFNKKGSIASDDKLKVTLTQEGDAYTFLIEGRIDTSSAPMFEERINEVIAKAKKLVLDLGKLYYISSAGLRVLLATAKEMNGQGELVITNVAPDVLEIFELTRLVDVLNIQ